MTQNQDQPNPSVADKNLALWEQVETTNPKFTKDFNVRGFQGTAIAPAYVFKRLTEMFGPCGVGWRFVIEEERMVYGPGEHGTFTTTDTAKGSTDVRQYDEREVLHVLRGHLDYRATNPKPPHNQGESWASTGPYFGQTKIVQRTKDGLRFVEDAPKMSVTDCLTKCAVQLGIGADIHMGMYEESKYRDDVSRSFAEKDTRVISEQQTKELEAKIASSGVKPSAFLRKYAIKSVKDLPLSMYDAACDAIDQYVAGKKPA